jgi:serine/tyrosine/threonine adenylyltransferase
MHDDRVLVRRLADHAIARHHPDLIEVVASDPAAGYLELFDRVVVAQAVLVAKWMAVGFIHGVMNTDNTTISGETIDYGPCAFMDAYDLATVFSSIDHAGRYAYGNQPGIMQWNLARLAEAMLPLFAAEPQAAVDRAVAVLERFPGRYRAALSAGMRRKLGLVDERHGDEELVDDLLALLGEQRADLTSTMRAMSAAVRGDATAARDQFLDPAAFDAWSARHLARLAADPRSPAEIARGMDSVNPVYVPRNHLVEEALAAATAGDLAPVEHLVSVLTRPFEERPGLARFARPDPAGAAGYRTFCGT